MSKRLPRSSEDMTEHSMCQPGLPLPHGESHDGSPGLAAFHSTKSSGSSFASSTSTRARVLSRQAPIALERGHVVVDVAVGGGVRVPARNQRLDHADHPGYGMR